MKFSSSVGSVKSAKVPDWSFRCQTGRGYYAGHDDQHISTSHRTSYQFYIMEQRLWLLTNNGKLLLKTGATMSVTGRGKNQSFCSCRRTRLRMDPMRATPRETSHGASSSSSATGGCSSSCGSSFISTSGSSLELRRSFHSWDALIPFSNSKTIGISVGNIYLYEFISYQLKGLHDFPALTPSSLTSSVFTSEAVSKTKND